MKTLFLTLTVAAFLFPSFKPANETIALNLNYTLDVESELLIEDWMIDDDSWRKAESNNVVEKEENLAIESWMTDDQLWRI